jgi:hypothetical protein
MKFAILSLATAAALTLSSGTVSAQWIPGPGHGGHLDYYNGHYHYHNGPFMSGPLYPAFPSYGYGYPYGSGLTLSFGGSSLGYGNLYPSLGYGSGYYSPYSSRWGYGSYRRW